MIDRQSDTWLEIEKHVDNELAAVGRKLASPHVNYDVTMYNRGIYAALTAIKEMPNKAATPVLEIDDYS